MVILIDIIENNDTTSRTPTPKLVSLMPSPGQGEFNAIARAKIVVNGK